MEGEDNVRKKTREAGLVGEADGGGPPSKRGCICCPRSSRCSLHAHALSVSASRLAILLSGSELVGEA